MIILEKFNTVIEYIEAHIGDDLDVATLASLACCSVYDFQRTFSFASGMSAAEYIRNRRLALAGADLRRGGMKVIDAAMKYGYDSPVSFSRAFRTFHGVNPSEVQRRGAAVKSFPRMMFQIYMKAVNEVEIVKKDAVILVGCLGGGYAGEVWGKWEAMSAEHEIKHGVLDGDGHSAGHEARFYTPGGERIFVGVEAAQTDPESVWEYLTLPPSTYAIFDIDEKIDMGPQFEAVNKWLEENADTYAQSTWDAGGRVEKSEFVICCYDHRTAGKYHQNRVMEMWIPLTEI
jgi:AraC-type DNA-binding domain-containing proteins